MSKYLNKKVVVDGVEFDSRKEYDYYLYLKQRQEVGEISCLRRQVPYELIPAVWGERVKHLKTKDKVERVCIQRPTTYVADFVYIETNTGKEVVVDVKSKYTRTLSDYRLKKKMMLAFKGIVLNEVVLG